MFNQSCWSKLVSTKCALRFTFDPMASTNSKAEPNGVYQTRYMVDRQAQNQCYNNRGIYRGRINNIHYEVHEQKCSYADRVWNCFHNNNNNTNNDFILGESFLNNSSQWPQHNNNIKENKLLTTCIMAHIIHDQMLTLDNTTASNNSNNRYRMKYLISW